MKNLFVLVGLVLLFLVGCGSSSGGADNSNSGSSTSKYDGTQWSVSVVSTTEYGKNDIRCSDGQGKLQINNSGTITSQFGINNDGDKYLVDGTIKENGSINLIAKNSEINDKVDFIGYLYSSGNGSGTWVSQTYGCKGNWSAELIKGEINSNEDTENYGTANNAICIENQTGNDIDTIDYMDKLNINGKYLKVKIDNNEKKCIYNLLNGNYKVYIYHVYWYSVWDGSWHYETFLYPKSGAKKLSGGETWNIVVK